MLPLFFQSPISDQSTLEVGGDEAHHAITVSRMEVGDALIVIDGRGNWAQGKIQSLQKKSFLIDIEQRGYFAQSSPRLTVIQALPKSDRVKEAIELMVEAGADRIIPWAATRSISKWQSDSQEKWSMTALTATKQSRRYRIPEISSVVTTDEIVDLITSSESALVLHESATLRISQAITDEWSSQSEIFLVIGPEGGITPEEISQLEAAGAHVVHLGDPVFRSAHAAAAALAAVQALIGRW